jgi:nucleotide-binding universal stress UspA family protein
MTTTTQTSHSAEHEVAAQPDGRAASESVFKNILCAVDGTRSSTTAVRMAAGLAGPNGHLTLLAVTAVSGSRPYATAAISPARARHLLTRARHVAETAGVPASTIVDPGSPPVKVILERASEYDLLAIGAPATSWLGGMLVGGVTDAALGQFGTPMLIVRRSSTGSSGRIVVASDGEEGSNRIVELAGRLGQSRREHVTLVNALVGESKMNPRAIQAQARALRQMLPDTGEPHIEPGKAWDVILDAARNTKADLIVMGSRRLDGLRALGSISRRVVHEAPCSVLVLPPA